MNIMKIINLARETGCTNLAGTDMGISHLPKLLAAALNADAEELVILDFKGVDATASYLSHSVVKLVRMAKAGDLERFFVFAGLNKHTRDDLEIVLGVQKLAAFVATSPEELQSTRSAEVLGHLEPVYRKTLDQVLTATSATATEIMSGAQREKIQKTGWLNRLAFLSSQRLIRREKRSREFIFKPIWEEE